MNVIIFGPPGAGKGTQAQNIVNKFKLHQFSTGELLRSEIKNKSEVGNKIEQIIDQGGFVSDDIVNKLLKKLITNLSYRNRIIFFTFFYTSITFNPNETAENLRKYGGFIPGIRPGESTALYIDNILNILTTIGALYLTLVCLMPEFLIANYPIPFYLGGTSILIVVVVAIDTVTQIQTRLMSSQYEQLIKKTKFGR